MFVATIICPRGRVIELYEFLDAREPQWTFYNTVTREVVTIERRDRVRQANEDFVKGMPLISLEKAANTYAVVSADTAMLLKLSWPDVSLIDLR